jgi:tetratricopeptide (TPR) repeat protein
VFRLAGSIKNALADLTEAIRLEPKNPEGFCLRGSLFQAIEDAKSTEKAIADYDAAIRVDPKAPQAYMMRGIVFQSQSKYEPSISDLTEAYRLAPADEKARYARALLYRGVCEYELGRYGKAIADLKQMIATDSQDSLGYRQLAEFLAACPDDKLRDGRKAVEAATKACELTKWRDSHSLEALAASHAEDWHFEDAVRRQKQAIDLLVRDGRKPSKSAEERLKMYEENRVPRYRSVKKWL